MLSQQLYSTFDACKAAVFTTWSKHFQHSHSHFEVVEHTRCVDTEARGGHGLSVKQTEEGETGRRSSVSSHGRQREAESLGWSRVKARAKERLGQTGTASSFPWTIRRLPRAPRLSAADTCGGRVECGLPERGGRLCLESRPASVNKSTA